MGMLSGLANQTSVDWGNGCSYSSPYITLLHGPETFSLCLLNTKVSNTPDRVMYRPKILP